MIKSNQEPIISTSINTLLPPALTYALPPERARAFQTSVANHLRAAHAKAQPEAAVIAHVRQVNDALGGPLDGDAVARLYERIMDEARRIQRLEAERDAEPKSDVKSES